jgi:hypothetical protein
MLPMNILVDLIFTENGAADRAGNIWTDTGSAHHYNNAGRFGINRSLTFTGNVANNWISMSSVSAMNFGLNDFTISFWMKAGTTNAGATGVFASPKGTSGWHDTSYFQGYSVSTNGRLFPTGVTGTQGILDAAWSVDSIWHHVAIVRKNAVTRIFRDGVQTASDTAFSNRSFNWAYNANFYIGVGATSDPAYPFAGAIDDFVVIDEALWDTEFTPPTTYLADSITVSGTIIVSQPGEAWSLVDGIFTKVGENWPVLTDNEKLALFAVAAGEMPTLPDLAALNSPFTVLAQKVRNVSMPPLTLTAVPFAKTILPEGLIPTTSFEYVNSVTFTGLFTADSGGFIKFAFTTDNQNYKVWDGSAWQPLDLADFAAGGMMAQEVHALGAAAFNLLLDGAEGFGTGIYISQETVEDNLHVDEMTVSAEMKGTWEAVAHGSGFTYGFSSAGEMTVNIASAGTYKINYDKGKDD